MNGDDERVAAHCPNCGAEYRAGFTVCADCGFQLEPGPTPEQRLGVIEIVHVNSETDAPTGTLDKPVDLFGDEEQPIRLVLCRLVDDDARDLVDLLERQGIGARLGQHEPEGITQVMIHAFRLPEAQATLVEFLGTGEPLDEPFEVPRDAATDASGPSNAWDQANARVWGDEPRSPGAEAADTTEEEEFVPLLSIDIAAAHHQAARLAAEGIDSKVVIASGALETDPSAKVDVLVPSDDLDEARRLLGLVL
jgi:hypothetical protein